jgi:hypothetical protein
VAIDITSETIQRPLSPMNSNVISLLTFVSLFVSALLAIRLRKALPDHHVDADTKDTVKLTMGLVATMTALVLGLLVASTKAAYDTEKSEVVQMAGKIIFLDRILANYGPESTATRAILSQTVEKAILRMWPEETSEHLPPDPSASWTAGLPDAIQKLAPQNDAQRAAKTEAAGIAADLGQMRWLLFEQEETSISMPMLLIVIGWLAILFFSFGLFAPAHGTAVGALLIAALSVSGGIFLILELDHPFSGFIDISSHPMRNALAHLGK